MIGRESLQLLARVQELERERDYWKAENDKSLAVVGRLSGERLELEHKVAELKKACAKPCLSPDYCGTADSDTLCDNCLPRAEVAP